MIMSYEANDSYYDDEVTEYLWQQTLKELEPVSSVPPVTQPKPSNESLYADLSGLLTGKLPEAKKPSIGMRSDGLFMLYEEAFNMLYGDPETAKTWVSLSWMADELNECRKCAYIDLDNNGYQNLGYNLVKLGARVEVAASLDNLRVASPDTEPDLLRLVADLIAWGVEYVVVDSLGELLPLMGGKSNDNDDVTTALNRFIMPLANSGACVVAIDHLPKGQESKGSGFSIGGMAKKRAINGAMYLVEVLPGQQPAPGRVGLVSLKVTKDRHGSVRSMSDAHHNVATFSIDSTDPDKIVTSFDPVSGAVARQVVGTDVRSDLMESVLQFLKADGGEVSGTRLVKSVRGRAADITVAVNALVSLGSVIDTGSSTGHRYKWVKDLHV